MLCDYWYCAILNNVIKNSNQIDSNPSNDNPQMSKQLDEESHSSDEVLMSFYEGQKANNYNNKETKNTMCLMGNILLYSNDDYDFNHRVDKGLGVQYMPL